MAEGLQIAQVIADLQTLQNADPTASLTLLSASKSPQSTSSSSPSKRPSLTTHPSSSSSTSTARHKSSNAIPRAGAYNPDTAIRVDKLGRRIVVPRPPGHATPPVTLTRSASSFGRFAGGGNGGNNGGAGGSFGRSTSSLGGSVSGSLSGSGVGTPVEGTQDEDLKRAKTLLELFEMRGKFKQMGDTGLTRAKQRVDTVVEKYAKMELEEREKAAKARHLDT